MTNKQTNNNKSNVNKSRNTRYNSAKGKTGRPTNRRGRRVKVDKNGNTASEITANKKTNKVVVSTMVIFSLLFIAMGIYYAYFVSVESKKIVKNEYNKRYDTFSKTVVRGSILSDSGEILAYTKEEDGKEERIYPFGKLFAHAVGLYNYGQTGIELAYNYDLLRSSVDGFKEIRNEFSGSKLDGDNVVTTLNRKLQQKSYDALGKNDGAIIAIDPETGKILSMVSKPTFDPNKVGEMWDELLSKDTKSTVLLNRVTQGLYTPGSTFKIFTAAEYLKENGDDSEFTYKCSGAQTFKGYKMRCYGNQAHGTEDLKESFANSCNGAFATIGTELDIDKFSWNMENRFFFNTQIPIDLKTTQSKFSLTSTDSEFDITQTAIGQGKTLVTPMHMVTIVDAIANGGYLIKPHIVDKIQNCEGKVVKSFDMESYGRVFSKSESETLMEYMRAVVTQGTAKILNNKKYEAYGKTGTAQLNKETDKVNSWFVGGAEKDGKKLCICVVIENVSEGSASATEAAGKVFDQYFK